LRVLFACFVLYLAFGKGFAYAGWPPVYVGEVLLAVALVAALERRPVLPHGVAPAVTALLVGIAIAQAAIDRLHSAVPLVETVRGLAPVYYALFAFAVYSLVRDIERRVGRADAAAAIHRGAAVAVPVVMLGLILVTAAAARWGSAVPRWPGSGGPLLVPKAGDPAVALVVVAPVLLGSDTLRAKPALRNVMLLLWVVVGVVLAFRSRGAMLALLVGLLLVRPHVVRLVKLLLAGLAVVLLLYVTGLRLDLGEREVSYDALVTSVASLGGSATNEELGSSYLGTRNWRADWWESIWADVRDEQMVFHGRGWGDNLALRHGITPSVPPDEERVLRLPHNLFLSLAGRAGLMMAIGFIAVPVLTIARTFSGSSPAPLTVQAARGGIAAALTTGMADVYIESPQGGIVIWVLIGYLWWATASPLPEPDLSVEPVAASA
jgi:hypothetical protein